MWKQLKSRPCEVTVKPPVPVFSSFEVGCSRRVSRRATELWAQFYGDTAGQFERLCRDWGSEVVTRESTESSWHISYIAARCSQYDGSVQS